MTSLDHIKRALRMLGILAESEAPDAAQGVACLVALNAMLGEWEGEGIRLALPPLALADNIPVPASHDNAISYCLATGLAGEFSVEVRPAVGKMADDTKRTLQAMYAYIPTLVCEPELARITSRRSRGR